VGLYVEEIVWIALNCIQIGSNGGILWSRLWTYVFHNIMEFHDQMSTQLSGAHSGTVSQSNLVSYLTTNCTEPHESNPRPHFPISLRLIFIFYSFYSFCSEVVSSLQVFRPKFRLYLSSPPSYLRKC
jgi:hypothetical protein